MGLHSAAVEPVVEFGHVALEVLRFDFVVRAQQKALQVGQGNVHPRKESMSGLRISVQGRGGMLKALLLQPLVAAPAIAQDPTAGLDLGVEKPVQAAGRRVGDDRQSRKPRNRFLAFLSGTRRSTATATTDLVLAPRPFWAAPWFRSAHVAFVDFDQALQSIALIAVRHGLANLMLHQPSRGVRDADLLAQLQRGNPFLVLAHAVDRPEPAREGSSSLVKNGTGGDRTLIPADGAFMNTPTGHVSSTAAAAARTNKTVRPTLSRQVLSTQDLVAKAGAEFAHRHDGFSFQPTRFFHKRYTIVVCSPVQA